MIELLEFFPDGLIQFCEAEEGVVSQGGQDPAFGDKTADSTLALSLGFADPGGDDHGAVMFGQV